MSQAETSAHATDTAPDRSTPLILVVEDDRIVHGLVKRFLQKAHFDYHGALSAEEALVYLQTHTPDLIFSDIQMEQMNGIDFCREVRQRPHCQDLPFIFFTGKSDVETMSLAFEAGASDYVVKPLREVELISRARRHVEDYRRKAEAKRRIHTLYQQNESKTRFLGVASHDLRNPLVSIRGISQFLESQRFGELNEGQREMVRTIIDASENMLTLVEDLLDISKIESDQMELKTEPVAPVLMLEKAARLHQPTAERKNIRIELVDRSEGARSQLDRRLIARVIDNLVSNAIKFSLPGTCVRLIADAFGDFVRIAVEDEGPGIPDNEFDKLFKEFSRTSNMPTGGESSSGIGLFVVKRIVQSHHGEISAENRPQGGARFCATFNAI